MKEEKVERERERKEIKGGKEREEKFVATVLIFAFTYSTI